MPAKMPTASSFSQKCALSYDAPIPPSMVGRVLAIEGAGPTLRFPTMMTLSIFRKSFAIG